MIRRARVVYVLLAVGWLLIIGWQAFEHHWVAKATRAALMNRASDITTVLGLIIRSQRRWLGFVSPERLESALAELVKSGELLSVALLNASGEVVSSAGQPMDLGQKRLVESIRNFDTKPNAVVRWGETSVTIVNAVDLGADPSPEGEMRPAIVLPRRDSTNAFRPRPGEGGFPRPRFPPPWATNRPPDGPRANRPSEPPPPPWRRPPTEKEVKEFKALMQNRGLHGLVMKMSTDSMRSACLQDLWLRVIISSFATISVLGLTLAWRNLGRSSELEMRLLKARELTTHLKAMNLAAAGLAHETRNPLNIIRGLAQMISKVEEASTEIRDKSREIIDEADRVTAQLNEFINYSRPRELRRTPVALAAVLGEVTRALSHDIEEKQIEIQNLAEPLLIEADEQQLRQALFNLLLNAIQAVDPTGQIQIRAAKRNGSDACLEILDNGPGISPENRSEIFKPYFTTNQKGTGLGLAVVQQIVLAHGWEIQCLPNKPRGAIFRILHLNLAAKA